MTSGRARANDTWKTRSNATVPTAVSATPTSAFFFVFAFEVVDGYGRLLCFLNVREPDRARRPKNYNLRILRAGLAVPSFIWPNIDPFLRASSFMQATVE